MSNKHIILAHGRNGEMGVSTDVDSRGLPWPSLTGDIDYLNSSIERGVVVMGRKSLNVAGKFLKRNAKGVLGVSTRAHADDGFTMLPTLEDAIRHAENWFGGRDIWFAGGATLASEVFRLLEKEGAGDFHETVIDADYPMATTFMPPFDEDKWSDPEIVAEFPVGFTDKGRRTASGIWLPEPTPPYRVQIRHVK